MKKQFVSLLFVAVAGILLSSCSNLSKISFTKRHYRSGYYVDFGGKNNTPNTSQSTAKIPVRTKYQVPTAIASKESDPSPVTASKTTEVNVTATQKIDKPKEGRYIKTVSNTSAPTFITNSSTSTYRNSESESEVHARVDVDVPMVVIILCAIFIPPLGVGLMYGINSYFWIDYTYLIIFLSRHDFRLDCGINVMYRKLFTTSACQDV